MSTTSSPASHPAANAIHAAVAGFFDLRALALSAVALLDTDAAQEDVVRVLTQLAGQATALANATDAAIIERS